MTCRSLPSRLSRKAVFQRHRVARFNAMPVAPDSRTAHSTSLHAQSKAEDARSHTTHRMTTLRQYEAAQALESFLGNPLNPENTFSFARSVEQDEREEYPEQACRMLDEWGLASYYIPADIGGRLSSYEELLALLRVVGRRDLTVAIAHGKTYL